MHGLLISVRYKSGGAGFSIRTMYRRVFFNGEEGEWPLSCKAEHRTFTAHHLLSPGFPSALANLRARVHPPHLPSAAGDSIPQLASASGKEGARSDQRVEDHVAYIAIELALVRHHALEVVHRKCDLGPSREKRGAKVCRFQCNTVSTG